MAVIILIGWGSAIFSATTFYQESKYQDLITNQNAEKIENNRLAILALKKEEDDKLASLQNEMRLQMELVRAYALELVKQEVGGLRTDWERKNEEVKLEQEKQDRQIEKVVDKLIN
jgi:hypothetical protein